MKTNWPKAINDGWHPVAYSNELAANTPLKVELMEQPIVLFRSEGRVSAFIDRCPHRNVPLSGGKVCGSTIICPYHGWQFNADGLCVKVPGVSEVPKISAIALHACEKHDLIWLTLSKEKQEFPILPSEITDAELDRFWWPLRPKEARAIDALENHLDPMHPHFLHPYLVRGKNKRLPTPVQVRSTPYGAHACYDESQLPKPFLPKLIEGSRVASHGHYYVPLTGQVSFENENGFSFSVTVIFSPVSENITRPYAHFATPRGKIPAWLKKRLIIAFNTVVLKQDASMLANQAQNISHFGEPNFNIGPADILAKIIWKRANGEKVDNIDYTLDIML